ncbi:MAG: hypothetical protein AAF587_43830, partial [Bacteroidota bacterium]
MLTPLSCFRYLYRRNPGKRYYAFSSSTTTEQWKRHNPKLNDGYLNDPSNDAFLIWSFENAYPKWKATLHLAEFEKTLKVDNPRITAVDFKARVDQETKELGSKLHSKYTTSSAGRAYFGGVTSKGLERYEELLKLVTDNRKDRKEEIRVIEEEILKRVREVSGREELDRKRDERKKKKPKSLVATTVEEDPNFKKDDF